MVKGVSYRVIEKKRGNSEVFLLASLPNEKWYKRYLWQSFMLWVKLQLDTKEAPLQKKGWWYMILFLFFAPYPKEFNFIHGGNLLFWWPSSQLKLVQLLLLDLKVLGQLGLWPDTAWKTKLLPLQHRAGGSVQENRSWIRNLLQPMCADCEQVCRRIRKEHVLQRRRACGRC